MYVSLLFWAAMAVAVPVLGFGPPMTGWAGGTGAPYSARRRTAGRTSPILHVGRDASSLCMGSTLDSPFVGESSSPGTPPERPSK
ncbi:hypothetical protein [Streptomyces viridochromogenes]|uniref:hypothetical protein n=1 Tax=Streptomyces viridochromogenes TaxID=1938 RepID=UPI00069CF4F9|nr:hypothetical protein [Streptomyces viridochromogenes]KOG23309.1 hypothetical protein ADK35_13595 [Streptomyces viridochromogenes]KOG27085.1 hypothetical protein ADK36_00475 [Streptomyces viridochromogenes]